MWVATCVGLLNYKPFLLFLVYTCLACALASGLLATPCIAFIVNEPEQPPLCAAPRSMACSGPRQPAQHLARPARTCSKPEGCADFATARRPALTFLAAVIDIAFALSVLGFLVMHARCAALPRIRAQPCACMVPSCISLGASCCWPARAQLLGPLLRPHAIPQKASKARLIKQHAAQHGGQERDHHRAVREAARTALALRQGPGRQPARGVRAQVGVPHRCPRRAAL